MAKEKALVTKRKSGRSRAIDLNAGAGSRNIEAASSGDFESGDTQLAEAIANEDGSLIIEQQTSDRAIVRVNEAQAAESDPFAGLEAQGYRVKRLPETNIIEVGAFRVDVEEGAESAEASPPELSVPPELADTWPHHLVQLIGPPTLEWINRIEEAGVDVAEPLSRYALFVCAPPERVASLNGLKMPGDESSDESFVAWTGPFQPAYRIAPELLEAEPGRLRYVNIGVYPADKVEEVARAVESSGGQIVNQWGQEGRYRDRFGFLIAELDSHRINEIARLPYVRSIEYQAPTLSAEDERAAQIVAEQFDGALPPATAPVPGYQEILTHLKLDGEGVVIGFCDSGVDTHDNQTMHPDLRGRLKFFVDVTNGTTPIDRKGHGTHVAGIAVGNGSSGEVEPGGWLLGQGIAPRAQFGSVNPVDTPGGPGTRAVGTFSAILAQNGSHIMNNSWGLGQSARYTANAALVDRLVRDPNNDNLANDANYLVFVFSIGNRGPGTSTMTEPKAAKNPITVGNSLNQRSSGDDIRGIAIGSSRGPTGDGRLAPTIVAPGTNIVSARSTTAANGSRPLSGFKDGDGTKHENYALSTGSSMAAPHVSGVCALLIQWWRNRTGENPSPALLKALLVNGAEDLAGGPNGRGGVLGHIPNNDQGWGRVSLVNIIADETPAKRGPKLIFDQKRPFTTVGEEHLINVEPFDASRPLRVTLVWTDPPGAVNAAPALVNDLDLEVVETASGQVYKGNVFADGFSQPGGDFDDLNNIECVYIRNPIAGGLYEINVIAQALTANALPPFTGAGFQDYALVIDNAREVTGEV